MMSCETVRGVFDDCASTGKILRSLARIIVVTKDRRGSSASLFVWYFHGGLERLRLCLGTSHPSAAWLSVFFHQNGSWQINRHLGRL
jgi:hypothetical protein